MMNAGDPSLGQLLYFEVFCNPNAYSTAFDAKVLLTLKMSEDLEVISEASLEQLRAAIDAA